VKHYKLDKRFKGFGDFKYTVDFNWRQASEFCELRNWCWDQWGPSSEIVNWEKSKDFVSKSWCWDPSEYKNRVYLASDKEYQWFLLKWG
jgi:hypothetical protein